MKKLFVFRGICALILPLMFLGCGGGGGSHGTDGGGPVAGVEPESCSICHGGNPEPDGADHQAYYDQLYQDGVNGMAVTGLAYTNNGVNDKVTFTMMKAGVPFDCTQADSLGVYFVAYDNTTRTFDNDNSARLSLSSGATTTSGANGRCTITKAETDLGNLKAVDGLIVLYGRDETVGTLPARIQQNRYPFSALLATGANGVDYASAANPRAPEGVATLDGCEKCHSVPYLKHGYIYGRVDHDAANDFYTCKACHQDNGEGGHFEWQLAVSDPERWAEIALQVEATPGSEFADFLTADELSTYAYKTRLMNDVHMSHAMEFPYPQSMSNCATCHAGKLKDVLTDANFVVETCKSCHPVTGPGRAGEQQPPALVGLLPIPGSITAHAPPFATACNGCHRDPADGGFAPVFSTIHTGYNDLIYADGAGTRYADAITVSIDNASFDGDNLTFSFSAIGNAGGLAAADIAPRVMVGLYGYDTKDYIVGPHERDFDDNRDGVVDSNDERNLEYDIGAVHPRFTTLSAAAGSWAVSADLSAWAGLIADGRVKRVEIAVLPALENANGETIALNSPSRTFDLGANAFVDGYYQGTNEIVRVETGCNNCHDALGTTFHSPDRGGNIVVCRLCHITKSGGSHLEMQSRSIDSYVHAIHSFQAFDIGDIDFGNPVQSLHYSEHIEFPFPTHGIRDCEACHHAGKYNVPDQSKSLPGVLSGSDFPLIGRVRNIGEVPSYITGPGSRVCGSCHRAHMINEDDAGELAAFNSHTRTFGYLVEDGDILAIIDEIFAGL